MELKRRTFLAAIVATPLAGLIQPNDRLLVPGKHDSEIEVGLFSSQRIFPATEARYKGYRRIALDEASWVVEDGAIYNAERITFPQATGGRAYVTHAAIFRRGQPAAFVIPLHSGLVVENGITAEFAARAIKITWPSLVPEETMRLAFPLPTLLS